MPKKPTKPRGRPATDNPHRAVSFWLPVDFHADVQRHARNAGLSTNAYVRIALATYMAAQADIAADELQIQATKKRIRK